MTENFLLHSPTYVKTKGSIRSNLKIDRLKLTTLVSKFMDEDLKLTKTKEVITKIVSSEFEEPPSVATVSNAIKTLENSWVYLISDRKAKETLLQNLSIKNYYHRTIRYGIDCLIKDGIENWEDIEKRKMTSNKEKPEGILGEEKEKMHPPAEIEKFPLISSGEAIGKFVETIMPALEELANYGEAEQRKELAECLDENLLLKERAGNLEEQLSRANERLSKACDEIRTIEEEKERMGVFNKKLKALLESTDNKKTEAEKRIAELMKENAELIGIKKDRDFLIKLKMFLKEQENETGKTQPITSKKVSPNNNGDDLPRTYKRTGVEIFYEESFIKSFQEAQKMIPKIAKTIQNKIKAICNFGIDKVSLQIKTLPIESTHTPKNSLQATVKKWRFTFQIFEDKVTFYELFPRKKSPFSTKNN